MTHRGTFQRNVLTWMPSLKGEKEHVVIDGHDRSFCGARADHSVTAKEFDPDVPPASGCKRCLQIARKR